VSARQHYRQMNRTFSWLERQEIRDLRIQFVNERVHSGRHGGPYDGPHGESLVIWKGPRVVLGPRAEGPLIEFLQDRERRDRWLDRVRAIVFRPSEVHRRITRLTRGSRETDDRQEPEFPVIDFPGFHRIVSRLECFGGVSGLVWASEAPRVRAAWAALALLDGARLASRSVLEHDYSRPGGYLMQDIGFLAGLTAHATVDRTVRRMESIGILVRYKPRRQRALYSFEGRPMLEVSEPEVPPPVVRTIQREIWRIEKGRRELWLEQRIANSEKTLSFLRRARMPTTETQELALRQKLNRILAGPKPLGRWGESGALREIDRLELTAASRIRRQ
jgi:hypothetical protein